MEELTQKIDELIELLKVNSMPLWISIVGIFVPIILSALIIGITIYQHKKNKAFQILINTKNEELQKMISDKELKVQMHGDILNIYDGYCVVQNTLGKANNNVATVLANPNILVQWLNELQISMAVICQAFNRAELLLPKSDMEFRKVLKSIIEKYRDLLNDIFEYINSGAADFNRNQTWVKIANTHSIQPNDYLTLYFNKDATADFIKLYANENTEKMNKGLKELMDLFESDKFDKYFEPYLSIYTETGDI